MEKLERIFVDCIKNCNNSLKIITEPKEQGMINALMALAISNVIGNNKTSIELDNENKENAKDALKPGADKKKKTTKKKETKVEEPKEEEIVEEQVAEEQVAEEQPQEETTVEENPQTEENQEVEQQEETEEVDWENISEEISQQVDLLYQYIDAWGSDLVYRYLEQFMALNENDMTDENFWSYVTPANIKACIAYLESVSAEE